MFFLFLYNHTSRPNHDWPKCSLHNQFHQAVDKCLVLPVKPGTCLTYTAEYFILLGGLTFCTCCKWLAITWQAVDSIWQAMIKQMSSSWHMLPIGTWFTTVSDLYWFSRLCRDGNHEKILPFHGPAEKYQKYPALVFQHTTYWAHLCILRLYLSVCHTW